MTREQIFTRRRFLSTAGAASVAVLAGCSGDDGGAGTDTMTEGGDDMADGGDDMTDEGDMADGGGNMSDGGDDMSDGDGDMSDEGDMADGGGNMSEGGGDMSDGDGDMTDEGGMDDGSDDMSDGGDDMSDGGDMDDDGDMDEGMSETTITYDVSALAPLDEGNYEGWAITDGEKISTGTMSPGSDVQTTADVPAGEIDKIAVTIEPEPDESEKPSGVVVLVGAVDGHSVDLEFPVDLGDAGGSYILATPTNGGESQETSGIWFLDPAGPAATLDLPTLPDGWVYEGWAVTQGTPLTSGRFSDPSGADDFDGFSGEMDGPPFPGEDYLQNAPSGVDFPPELADGGSKVVVSVEPDIDGTDPTGGAPFSIKPLVGAVPADAADHTRYDLQQNLDTVPTGTATVG
jgi:hypothetical protein